MKLIPVPLTPLDKMFQGGPIAYTPGSVKRSRPKEPASEDTAAHRGERDDDAPTPQGGKLFSELLREYLKDREDEPPTEPDDEPT